MANESEAQGSSSAGDSYIGSFMSLISKYEIRYEGVLYYLNIQDSTVGLKRVRSFGTEGRRKEGPQIPPSDKVYEYILFRASDIKDLQVKSSPPAQTEEHIQNDPAIIQSHHAGVPLSSPPSSLIGNRSLTDTADLQDTPALMRRDYPGVLPSYQPVAEGGMLNHLPLNQVSSSPPLSLPKHLQGYNGTSFNISQSPQQPIPFQNASPVSYPLIMQNQILGPELLAPATIGLDKNSARAPSSSASVYQNLPPSLNLEQHSTSLNISSSLAPMASMPSQSLPITAIRSTMSYLSPFFLGLDSSKAFSDPVQVPAGQAPYSASSFGGSTTGPLITPQASSSTLDQLTQSGSHVLSSSQKLYPEFGDFGTLTQSPSNPSLLIPAPVHQAPLLPLPTSAQKFRYSNTQFTEEFDFNAMNDKFKKDEVWGYLGKANQGDKTGVEDCASSRHLGEKEGHTVTKNPKPAYNKDEFFDTISCNSLTRGARNGQNRFSERMKQDSETFGIQQRPNLWHSGYGVGHGPSFTGSHNWGRGYRYGGRGHGGNRPF